MKNIENEFNIFLNEYKNINSDGNYLTKASVKSNKKINTILYQHGYTNGDTLRIERLICILSRYKINKICQFNRVDSEIFDFIKVCKEDNIKYLYALVINCLLEKISYKELKEFNQFIESKEKFYTIDYFIHNDKKGNYIYSDYLKFFDNTDFIKKNMILPEGIPYKYYLNAYGNKLIDNIYLDVTPKMKEYYSKYIFDNNKMEKRLCIREHYNYYCKILEELSKDDTIRKVARLHDKIFKDFFEEYGVLISYAYEKYGCNCKLEWCGMKTQKDNGSELKYDGIIENNSKREFVEICCPQYDKQNKNVMEELNKKGITFNSKILSWNELMSKIKDSISKKNKKTKSYSEKINLVIGVNLQDVDEDNYDDIVNIEKRFDELKKINYIFGNVYILIEKIIMNEKEIKPRIIKIK